jgi:hypothetical protein
MSLIEPATGLLAGAIGTVGALVFDCAAVLFAFATLNGALNAAGLHALKISAAVMTSVNNKYLGFIVGLH